MATAFFVVNRSPSFGSDGNSEKGEINGAEMGAGGLNQKEEEHDTGTPTYCMRKKNLLKLGQFKAKSIYVLNWGNRGMMAYFDALRNVAAPGADGLDPLGYAHIYYMYCTSLYTIPTTER